MTGLDLLFPPRCPVCHGLAPVGEDFCPGCREKLPVIRTRRCRKCGKPVPAGESLCEACREGGYLFDEGLGLCLYAGSMKKTMSYLKYRGRAEYGRKLGRVLAEEEADRIAAWRPAAVVPVPVHPSRLRSRGYNQAELIAAGVSEVSGIPLRTDLIFRKKETAAMKTLSAGGRKEALRDAFSPAQGAGEAGIPGRALLVDDIYTTGATLDACAHVLRGMGVRRVYFLTVCTGGGHLARF